MSENAFNRPRCELHDKVLYRSKKDARGSLVGALGSRRIRIYPCSTQYGYHLTKEPIRYQNKSHKTMVDFSDGEKYSAKNF
jgi:hypothetical protein